MIGETIESVLNQTYDNWEHVIVDDGSKDQSVEIVKAYAEKDERIKVFQRERSLKGASTCRNIGIEKATGEYLIFLDSDDLLGEICLNQRIEVAKNYNSFDFLTFPMLLFSDDIETADTMVNITQR